MNEHGFSGKRTAEIVDITYRQLDYWARTDLVRPSLAEATGSASHCCGILSSVLSASNFARHGLNTS